MKTLQIFRLMALMAGLVAVTSEAMAAQLRLAESDAEIVAVISAREVSRIALEGDRIASLAAVPQGFSIDHDADTGDLYIVPNPGFKITGLVNMFITSEAGRSYQLLLEPRDIPSEQIIIRNSKLPVADPAEVGAPRREELGNLVRAVITGALLDSYNRAAAAPDALGDTAEIVPIEVWRGSSFVAWKIKITGATETVQSRLTPSAAAIWLSHDGQEGVVVMEAVDGQ